MDEIDSIQTEVNHLKQQGVNKIIAVGHAGYAKDQEIARRVNGVDIVVGGHTDTFLYTGKKSASSRELMFCQTPTEVLSKRNYTEA